MPTLALRAVCLCKSRLPAGKVLYYIPLLVLLTANLWYGLRMNQPLPCIVTHSAFNALSAFANEADMTPRRLRTPRPGGRPPYRDIPFPIQVIDSICQRRRIAKFPDNKKTPPSNKQRNNP